MRASIAVVAQRRCRVDSETHVPLDELKSQTAQCRADVCRGRTPVRLLNECLFVEQWRRWSALISDFAVVPLEDRQNLLSLDAPAKSLMFRTLCWTLRREWWPPTYRFSEWKRHVLRCRSLSSVESSSGHFRAANSIYECIRRLLPAAELQ